MQKQQNKERVSSVLQSLGDWSADSDHNKVVSDAVRMIDDAIVDATSGMPSELLTECITKLLAGINHSIMESIRGLLALTLIYKLLQFPCKQTTGDAIVLEWFTAWIEFILANSGDSIKTNPLILYCICVACLAIAGGVPSGLQVNTVDEEQMETLLKCKFSQLKLNDDTVGRVLEWFPSTLRLNRGKCCDYQQIAYVVSRLNGLVLHSFANQEEIDFTKDPAELALRCVENALEEYAQDGFIERLFDLRAVLEPVILEQGKLARNSVSGNVIRESYNNFAAKAVVAYAFKIHHIEVKIPPFQLLNYGYKLDDTAIKAASTVQAINWDTIKSLLLLIMKVYSQPFSLLQVLFCESEIGYTAFKLGQYKSLIEVLASGVAEQLPLEEIEAAEHLLSVAAFINDDGILQLRGGRKSPEVYFCALKYNDPILVMICVDLLLSLQLGAELRMVDIAIERTDPPLCFTSVEGYYKRVYINCLIAALESSMSKAIQDDAVIPHYFNANNNDAEKTQFFWQTIWRISPVDSEFVELIGSQMVKSLLQGNAIGIRLAVLLKKKMDLQAKEVSYNNYYMETADLVYVISEGYPKLAARFGANAAYLANEAPSPDASEKRFIKLVSCLHAMWHKLEIQPAELERLLFVLFYYNQDIITHGSGINILRKHLDMTKPCIGESLRKFGLDDIEKSMMRVGSHSASQLDYNNMNTCDCELDCMQGKKNPDPILSIFERSFNDLDEILINPVVHSLEIKQQSSINMEKNMSSSKISKQTKPPVDLSPSNHIKDVKSRESTGTVIQGRPITVHPSPLTVTREESAKLDAFDKFNTQTSKKEHKSGLGGLKRKNLHPCSERSNIREEDPREKSLEQSRATSNGNPLTVNSYPPLREQFESAARGGECNPWKTFDVEMSSDSDWSSEESKSSGCSKTDIADIEHESILRNSSPQFVNLNMSIECKEERSNNNKISDDRSDSVAEFTNYDDSGNDADRSKHCEHTEKASERLTPDIVNINAHAVTKGKFVMSTSFESFSDQASSHDFQMTSHHKDGDSSSSDKPIPSSSIEGWSGVTNDELTVLSYSPNDSPIVSLPETTHCNHEDQPPILPPDESCNLVDADVFAMGAESDMTEERPQIDSDTNGSAVMAYETTQIGTALRHISLQTPVSENHTSSIVTEAPGLTTNERDSLDAPNRNRSAEEQASIDFSHSRKMEYVEPNKGLSNESAKMKMIHGELCAISPPIAQQDDSVPRNIKSHESDTPVEARPLINNQQFPDYSNARSGPQGAPMSFGDSSTKSEEKSLLFQAALSDLDESIQLSVDDADQSKPNSSISESKPETEHHTIEISMSSQDSDFSHVSKNDVETTKSIENEKIVEACASIDSAPRSAADLASCGQQDESEKVQYSSTELQSDVSPQDSQQPTGDNDKTMAEGKHSIDICQASMDTIGKPEDQPATQFRTSTATTAQEWSSLTSHKSGRSPQFHTSSLAPSSTHAADYTDLYQPIPSPSIAGADTSPVYIDLELSVHSKDDSSQTHPAESHAEMVQQENSWSEKQVALTEPESLITHIDESSKTNRILKMSNRNSEKGTLDTKADSPDIPSLDAPNNCQQSNTFNPPSPFDSLAPVSGTIYSLETEVLPTYKQTDGPQFQNDLLSTSATKANENRDDQPGIGLAGGLRLKKAHNVFSVSAAVNELAGLQESAKSLSHARLSPFMPKDEPQIAPSLNEEANSSPSAPSGPQSPFSEPQQCHEIIDVTSESPVESQVQGLPAPSLIDPTAPVYRVPEMRESYAVAQPPISEPWSILDAAAPRKKGISKLTKLSKHT